MSATPLSMAAAGLALLVIGLLAAKSDIAAAHGLDRIVALGNLCFAIPLAVFGALHLSGPGFVEGIVPPYMPWRSFWVFAVGLALMAASLSIATKVAVRWSALLFGIMMFLFVLMIHLPGALHEPSDRILWTIVLRETAFGGGGLVLAGIAMRGNQNGQGRRFITAGRIAIAIATIVFGVEHFLHPLGLPGVPLRREMPAWVTAASFIDYLTGAFLIVGGACFLLARKTREAASYLGAWIVLLVVVIYWPFTIAALMSSSVATQVEGINYFADTLLFGAIILSLARATTTRPLADSVTPPAAHPPDAHGSPRVPESSTPPSPR